jgi:hypothetical protein
MFKSIVMHFDIVKLVVNIEIIVLIFMIKNISTKNNIHFLHLVHVRHFIVHIILLYQKQMILELYQKIFNNIVLSLLMSVDLVVIALIMLHYIKKNLFTLLVSFVNMGRNALNSIKKNI